MQLVDNIKDNNKLLIGLNRRDRKSFSDVYMLFISEMNYFADKLFQGSNVASEDIVQDVFVSLWKNNAIVFENMSHLKSYLYSSIKNKHKDYLRHKLVHENYADAVLKLEDEYFDAMVESEALSLMSTIENILPAEMSNVIKLLAEGYEIKEISKKLNKSIFTIYNQRNQAIKILKRKLNVNKIHLFLIFLGK